MSHWPPDYKCHWDDGPYVFKDKTVLLRPLGATQNTDGSWFVKFPAELARPNASASSAASNSEPYAAVHQRRSLLPDID